MKRLLIMLLLSACKTMTPELPQNNSKPIEEAAKPMQENDITNIYWMPKKYSQNSMQLPGFFLTNQGIFGHDGCNRFWGTYTTTKDGEIAIEGFTRTELECIVETFSPPVGIVKSISRKGDTLLMKMSDQSERTFYAAGEPFSKENALTGSNWRLVASNHPLFETVKTGGTLPSLHFTKEGFLLSYYKDQRDPKATNYFEGLCNLGKNHVLLYTTGSSGVLTMPNGEDGQLASSVLYSTKYELQTQKLTLTNNGYTFTFEPRS